MIRKYLQERIKDPEDLDDLLLNSKIRYLTENTTTKTIKEDIAQVKHIRFANRKARVTKEILSLIKIANMRTNKNFNNTSLLHLLMKEAFNRSTSVLKFNNKPTKVSRNTKKILKEKTTISEYNRIINELLKIIKH